MVGLPNILLTTQDWLNAVEYARSTRKGKDVMISRLKALKQNTKINILKEISQSKPAEEQTPEDYESVDDPNCDLIRLGFSNEEIDRLIGVLE